MNTVKIRNKVLNAGAAIIAMICLTMPVHADQTAAQRALLGKTSVGALSAVPNNAVTLSGLIESVEAQTLVFANGHLRISVNVSDVVLVDKNGRLTHPETLEELQGRAASVALSDQERLHAVRVVIHPAAMALTSDTERFAHWVQLTLPTANLADVSGALSVHGVVARPAPDMQCLGRINNEVVKGCEHIQGTGRATFMLRPEGGDGLLVDEVTVF